MSNTKDKAARSRRTGGAAHQTPPLSDTTNTTAIATAPAASTAATKPPKKAPRGKGGGYAALEARVRAECQATLEAAIARERADAEERLAEKEHQMATMRRIEAEADEEAATLNTIPHPPGSAGRNYCIMDAMGLEDNKDTYLDIIDSMHTACIESKLDRTVRYKDQPAAKLAKVCQKVREKQPFCKRLINDWPTQDLLRQYLKHCRQNKKAKAAKVAAQQKAHPLPIAVATADAEMDGDA